MVKEIIKGFIGFMLFILGVIWYTILICLCIICSPILLIIHLVERRQSNEKRRM